MSGYLDHGSRHRPGGTDPIPGVIVYDFENVGDWLWVKSTSPDSPAGYGIRLEAQYGILIDSTDFSEVTISATGSGDISIIGYGGTMNLENGGGPMYFQSMGGAMRFDDAGGGTSFGSNVDSTFQVWTNAGANPFFEMDGNTGNVKFTLPVGSTWEVQNHLGQPLFRVDEDGDLHGKTGKALTFDA